MPSGSAGLDGETSPRLPRSLRRRPSPLKRRRRRHRPRRRLSRPRPLPSPSHRARQLTTRRPRRLIPARIAPPEARRRDLDLAAERTLIEQARSAFARNQGEAALTALGRHQRAFPDGELREERESLMVQVLVGLERYDEARRAGARFRRRFPQSIFGPVVEEALRSIPSIP